MQVNAPGVNQWDEQGVQPQAVRAVRQSLVSEELLVDLAETFSALGDPNRVKILLSLATTELCVSDLSSVIGISESAVSQHLRVLRSLRWVKGRRAGRMVYYSLDDDHVRSLLELEIEHIQGG